MSCLRRRLPPLGGCCWAQPFRPIAAIPQSRRYLSAGMRTPTHFATSVRSTVSFTRRPLAFAAAGVAAGTAFGLLCYSDGNAEANLLETSASASERVTPLLSRALLPPRGNISNVALCAGGSGGGMSVSSAPASSAADEGAAGGQPLVSSNGSASVHHECNGNRCNKVYAQRVGRHYVRLLSPAARRHLVRVYRLALGGISCAAAGFTAALFCLRIPPHLASAAGVSSPLAVLESAYFELPVGAALAALLSAIVGPAGAAQCLASLSSIAPFAAVTASTAIALPLWAPFAAVFVGVAALAVSSRFATARHSPSSSIDEKNNQQTNSASKKAIGKVVALRRAIFFALSFAEGALIVPAAKALMLTQFALMAFAVSFAVVAGFAAVAAHRGLYGLDAASSLSCEVTDECNGLVVFANAPPLQETAFLAEGSFYGCGLAAALLAAASALPFGGGDGASSVGGSVGEASVACATAAAAAVGGFSPAVVAAVAVAVALYVASDTAVLLEQYAVTKTTVDKNFGASNVEANRSTNNKSESEEVSHISSFFIADTDEDDDFAASFVDAAVGLALALAGAAVRCADVVAAVPSVSTAPWAAEGRVGDSVFM